jgi:hypothetical protein
VQEEETKRLTISSPIDYIQKLLAAEMDYWQRSYRKSRSDRIWNDEIHEKKKDIERTIMEDIEMKQLIWFGHMK